VQRSGWRHVWEGSTWPYHAHSAEVPAQAPRKSRSFFRAAFGSPIPADTDPGGKRDQSATNKAPMCLLGVQCRRVSGFDVPILQWRQAGQCWRTMKLYAASANSQAPTESHCQRFCAAHSRWINKPRPGPYNPIPVVSRRTRRLTAFVPCGPQVRYCSYGRSPGA